MWILNKIFFQTLWDQDLTTWRKDIAVPSLRHWVQAAEPLSRAGCLGTETPKRDDDVESSRLYVWGRRLLIGWRSLLLAHFKEEGEGVVSKLSQELLLDLGVSQLLLVLQLRVNLPCYHEKVSPESHTHHIHILAAVTERARQHHID